MAQYYEHSLAKVLEHFDSFTEGLTTAEAKTRLGICNTNVLKIGKGVPGIENSCFNSKTSSLCF